MTNTGDESEREPISTRIDTIFLPVTDFESAVTWYSDVLGFPTRWRNDENGYAALEIGETPLTLVRSTEPYRGERELFNFYTADIEETHRELQNRGVDVDSIQETADVDFFQFRDVCGNVLAFCCYEQ